MGSPAALKKRNPSLLIGRTSAWCFKVRGLHPGKNRAHSSLGIGEGGDCYRPKAYGQAKGEQRKEVSLMKNYGSETMAHGGGLMPEVDVGGVQLDPTKRKSLFRILRAYRVKKRKVVAPEEII